MAHFYGTTIWHYSLLQAVKQILENEDPLHAVSDPTLRILVKERHGIGAPIRFITRKREELGYPNSFVRKKQALDAIQAKRKAEAKQKAAETSEPILRKDSLQ